MSDGERDIWRQPPKGDYPDPALFGFSGLEQLQAARRLQSPIPPIAYLTEILFTELGAGHGAFTMPASPWFANAAGLIPGGMLAVLADAPLGVAVHTDLPPATAYTTAELSLTMLRPVYPRDGAKVVGSGQLIHRSRSVALSEAFLLSEPDGELVAHTTSRCTIFPPLDPTPEPPSELPQLDIPIPGESADDPLNQELRGEFLPQNEFDSRSGREIVDAWLEEELPPPPIFFLIGLRITGGGDGEAAMALPCSPWLSSALRTVQGGFIAMLAEATMATAVFTTAPAGTAFAPLDLKVNFLRPVLPDMRDLTASAQVVHRGRSLAVTTARLENADGKPVALATGSAMYLPGRSANLSGIDQLGGGGEES